MMYTNNQLYMHTHARATTTRYLWVYVLPSPVLGSGCCQNMHDDVKMFCSVSFFHVSRWGREVCVDAFGWVHVGACGCMCPCKCAHACTCTHACACACARARACVVLCSAVCLGFDLQLVRVELFLLENIHNQPLALSLGRTVCVSVYLVS